MNPLTIELQKVCFAPSDVIRGTARWSLEGVPKCVTLHIGWYTIGRGTKDACVEFEKEWETAFSSGAEAFEFSLPHAPYSFAGKLIELKWYVSLEVEKGDAYARKDIVVSPQDAPISLV